MFVDWPDQSEDRFGRDILLAQHNISQTDLFTDDGLAHLLDEYPRENLDIWTFGEQGTGPAISMRGRAPKMSGADIIDAVQNGKIWLNLRRAGAEVFDLEHISSTIFDSLNEATGQRTTKNDMGLLISSPNVEVNYHLDVPLVTLLQLRGRKKLWLYPRDENFAPSKYIEEIVHMQREEELPYRPEFDDFANAIELRPGMGLTWPQFAPHRVRNENCINVSLSCEYMTMKSLVNANAAYTNAFLRENFNMSPVLADEPGALDFAKAAFAQVHKRLRRSGPRKSPTPITFELDVSRENCVKPLWA
ncbi:MAG: hypothetical protein AAGJ68_05870 [Pseudomonadota bacterium]